VGRMLERDWDRDFDLTAWRALSRQQRKSWIEQARRREDEREARGGAGWELPITAWQRYERGQTVWDIGPDPQPFDVTLAEAVGEVKPELFNGWCSARRTSAIESCPRCWRMPCEGGLKSWSHCACASRCNIQSLVRARTKSLYRRSSVTATFMCQR